MIDHYIKIRIGDYDYHLLEERIAKYPLAERDASKLLVYKENKVTDEVFSSLPDYLPNDTLLLVNNTKVIPARIMFYKNTGAKIEVFCLEPLDGNGDYAVALALKNQCRWKCIAGNLKKWKGVIEANFIYQEVAHTLFAEIESRVDDAVTVLFKWDVDLDFATVVELVGKVPLPPYIKRDTEASDKLRYQTVYAHFKGSVAAPTAGLHFTDRVFEQLRKKNIEVGEVTLHVGAGTFKPVSAELIGDHVMHAEHVVIEKSLLQKLIAHGDKPMVAVGTTTVRSIESLVQIARKILANQVEDVFTVTQWDTYQGENQDLDKKETLDILMDYMEMHGLTHIEAQTSLMIVPGYQIRFFDAIITNFHQPKSTLLLLVSAFIGQDWKELYKHALDSDYRFLSYGDSSLLFRK
jgi:S-adenosylmethionine:tRNA ribosyltransferase-isomerase